MSRQFYQTRMDALESFIKHHESDYIYFTLDEELKPHGHIDTTKLFDDFQDELRSTLGDLFYLDYETQ